MSVPDAHWITRTIARYHSRTVQVELTAALTFQMLEAHHTIRKSYWARIWPSSIALSRWVLDEPTLAVSSKELGCGLGLVSMALAHRGVLADGTDKVEDALAFALRNADRNAIVGLSVSHLDWGAPTGVSSELIVGSDIVYDPESPARLFAMLETDGLLVPGGKLVISGPHRRADLFDELRKRMVVQGYVHSEVNLVVDWEGAVEVIDVHMLMRP